MAYFFLGAAFFAAFFGLFFAAGFFAVFFAGAFLAVFFAGAFLAVLAFLAAVFLAFFGVFLAAVFLGFLALGFFAFGFLTFLGFSSLAALKLALVWMSFLSATNFLMALRMKGEILATSTWNIKRESKKNYREKIIVFPTPFCFKQKNSWVRIKIQVLL